MDRIIIQTKNPRDITFEEADELAQEIRSLDLKWDVRVISGKQVGYGVTWSEILHIWLPTAGVIVMTEIIHEITKLAIKWARQRFKKEGPSIRPRPVYVAIYGPDGKVLKSVVIKNATDEIEDHTEADRESQESIKKTQGSVMSLHHLIRYEIESDMMHTFISMCHPCVPEIWPYPA